MRAIKIAVITSRFNEPVTSKMQQSCLNTLEANGVDSPCVLSLTVPGAVELPLIAQAIAKRGEYDAIICLGCVIRGETGHYDFVCEQASQGIQKIMLDYEIPVVFGVLTTDTAEQAFARAGGDHSDKGADSALVALEMVDMLRKLSHNT